MNLEYRLLNKILLVGLPVKFLKTNSCDGRDHYCNRLYSFVSLLNFNVYVVSHLFVLNVYFKFLPWIFAVEFRNSL